MRTQTKREFDTIAPDMRLIAILPALFFVGVCIAIAIGAFADSRNWLLLPVALTVAALLFWIVRRRRVVLDGDTLRLSGGVNNHRVAAGELDLERAEVVDLTAPGAPKPAFKTLGTAMPGYRAGHFRMRDRSRAFLIVTDPKRVLHLRERGGRHLLLSLERPQALLDALRAVAERGSRR